jgi:hypothetical protein
MLIRLVQEVRLIQVRVLRIEVEMTVGTMGTSDVQGNTISNINFSTTIELLQQQGFFQEFLFCWYCKYWFYKRKHHWFHNRNDAIQVSSTASLGLLTEFMLVRSVRRLLAIIKLVGSVQVGQLRLAIHLMEFIQWVLLEILPRIIM